MEKFISIHFKNGRRRWIDLSSFVSSEPFGTNLATELDLRLDDISEGLYLEISYNAPKEEERPEWGQAPKEQDERGVPCELAGGAYYCVLEPHELKSVSQIEADGGPMLKAFGDHLVVLEKLTTLCRDYLDDPTVTYPAIAELYPILLKRVEERGQNLCEGDIDRLVAQEMGIDLEVLDEARKAADLAVGIAGEGDTAKDTDCGLPWANEDGEEARGA